MIETWSRGPADESMAEDILVHLEPTIRRHPWWRARATLLLSLLEDSGVRRGAHVLDAGCGWGVTLDALDRAGYRTSGLDISRRALERLDHPDRELIEADLVGSVPAGAREFDAVVALDVIEHIDDDRAALENLCRLTRPGGIAIVSVPALPELFTEFDRIQGHRRRYVPATLTRAFDGTGLAVERMLWWGAWLVPVLRAQRRRTRGTPDMTPLHVYAEYVRVPRWPVSAALRLGFAIDHRRTLRNKTKRGTSLIAVARRAHG